LQRFPQLAPDDELALDVIYGEFLLREELGQRPEPREYLFRFPELADMLQDQIEFHQVMAASDLSWPSDEDTRPSESAAQQTKLPESGLPAHRTHFVPGYEILSELGRGGMGSVYLGERADGQFEQRAAVKLIQRGAHGILRRFLEERRILALIAEGLTNRQIGERLFLAEKTVKNYVSSLLAKLGMERRTQAAVYASHLEQQNPRST